jgi:hypothetical protein
MLQSDSEQSVLCVGIVAEANAPMEFWQSRLIHELGACDGIRFAGIELVRSSTIGSGNSLLENTVLGVDRLLTSRGRSRPRTDWAGVSSDLVRRDRTSKLDIVIDLRRGAASASPACEDASEVWTIDMLKQQHTLDAAGIQLALSGVGAFSVALQSTRQADTGQIDEAFCAGRKSAARISDQIGQASGAMILRTLKRRLASGNAGTFQKRGEAKIAAATKSHRQLSAIRYAGTLSAHLASRAKDSAFKYVSEWRGTLEPHFQIFHAQSDPLDLRPELGQPLSRSRHHYCADPFLLRRAGKLWAFFEVFDYRRNAGSIGTAELGADGLGPISIILSGDGHWSYPYVFEHLGEVFLVPETCARRRVEVWRATNFPYEWELASTALEGAVAVDSNVYHDGVGWWLFSNVAGDPEADVSLELNIFRSDGPLLQTLRPHVQNPVVVDARYARNGGRMFKVNQKLYRPAQSHEYGQYGYGLYLMDVLKLDSERYVEQPVHFVPGCHHLDVDGPDILFDVRRGTRFAESESREHGE